MERKRQVRRRRQARLLPLTYAIVVALFAIGSRAAFADPLAVAAPNLATPKDPQALDHLRRGNLEIEQGDALAEQHRTSDAVQHYDAAIAEYGAGEAIEPLPIFWFNIGLADRKAGRYAEAARAYRKFLVQIADDPSAEADSTRHQAEEVIRAMDAAATSPPTEPAGGTEPPAAGQLKDDSGTHQPSIWTGKRKLAVAAGGVGVMAIAIGVGFDLHGGSLEDTANALCPSPTTCGNASEANALDARANASYRESYIGYGVAAASLVAAAVLWFTGSPHPAQSVAVLPRLSPGFAGIDAAVRF